MSPTCHLHLYFSVMNWCRVTGSTDKPVIETRQLGSKSHQLRLVIASRWILCTQSVEMAAAARSRISAYRCSDRPMR